MTSRVIRCARGVRTGVLLLVTMAAGAGCVSPGGVQDGTGTTAAETAQTVTAQPTTPALVDVDMDNGFTVTEAVSLSGKARTDYREAIRLLGEGSTEQGIGLLEQVVASAPDATAPHVDLGIAYAQTGALEKAETSLATALTATPDHPIAHNELGIVYRRMGRFAEARQSYERALAIYPGFHFARRNLAVLCDLYLADYACALAHYGIYQQAVVDDREVNMWVRDIEGRLGAE